MGGVITSSGDCVKAQVIPDGTLGAESSVVTPNVDINGLPTDQIDGGAIRGTNLFHSFEQFSIPTGGAVYFNNALDIQNIVSRVTGSSISNIDGLLGANGSANLFLLNPNGIIFGPNASLNIGGSFVGSTASSLNLADDTQFSATAPQTTPLLTVSVPLGLQFGGTAGSIVNQSRATNSSGESVGLQVQPGATLALIGGDVRLDGGNLQAPGGRVELGGVAGSATVGLNVDGNNLRLSYPAGVQRADVSLTNEAMVDASGEGGGDIQLQGRRVTLTGDSHVLSKNSGAGAGGTLAVTASESVELSGGFTYLATNTFGIGSAGNLMIETRKLTVADGAFITTTPDLGAEGQGGDLMVRASDSVELIGTTADGQYSSGLFAQAPPESTGNGGNLTIETGQLLIRDGAQATASTLGAGRAGNLIVRALDSVELVGTGAVPRENGQLPPSGLFAQVEPQATTGDSGDMTIETGRLIVQGGAQVSTAARNQGQGGTLTINASDSIELSGALPTATEFQGSSGLFVSAEPGATRNAGDLRVTTGRLTVLDGAKISADNFGTGQGGNATLNVRQLTVRDGGLVRAGSLISPQGQPGGGPGGTLTVNASESVEVSGTGTIGSNSVNSTLFTATQTDGNAGNLRIGTGSLTVQDEAEVNVSSTGSGSAGNLQIQARSIRLDNNGAFRATTNSGNGGDISLQAQDLLLRRSSNISTRAGTEEIGGTGGSIFIDTDNLVALEDSDIDADALGGTGGQVIINAQGIFGTERREQQTLESDITASSNLGPQFSGIVEINNPDVDPTQGLVVLPTEIVDATGLIATGCPASVAQGDNKFIITGRGGLPPNPNDPLIGDNVLTDWNTLDSDTENRSGAEEGATNSTKESANTQIVEANGWVIGDNGEVTLVATAPTATLEIPWLPKSDCNAPEPSS